MSVQLAVAAGLTGVWRWVGEHPDLLVLVFLTGWWALVAIWVLIPVVVAGSALVSVALWGRPRHRSLAVVLSLVSTTSGLGWAAVTADLLRERGPAVASVGPTAEESVVALERYSALKLRFGAPQRVDGVADDGLLLLGDDAALVIDQPEALREPFRVFARERLVGREVTIDLGDPRFFLDGYQRVGGWFDQISPAEIFLDGEPLSRGAFQEIPPAGP